MKYRISALKKIELWIDSMLDTESELKMAFLAVAMSFLVLLFFVMIFGG